MDTAMQSQSEIKDDMISTTQNWLDYLVTHTKLNKVKKNTFEIVIRILYVQFDVLCIRLYCLLFWDFLINQPILSCCPYCYLKEKGKSTYVGDSWSWMSIFK